MIKNKKGFTLVELVIVIVIVGILSVISVPIYRGYVEKAMITEGKVLLNAIAKAELAYFVKNGYFLNTGGSYYYDADLDIDTRGNKYFTRFRVRAGVGDNIPEASVNLAALADDGDYDDDNIYAEIWVYGSNGRKDWVLHTRQWGNGAMYGDDDDIDVDNYEPK